MASKQLNIRPITIKHANEFVDKHHRHHRPTTRNSGRWAIAVTDESGNMLGVAIVGNPVSATYMDGVTAEVTRLCVIENSPKGTCSFLLSRCSKIWHAMGGERIITYTLEKESGSSLKGAGWDLVGTVKPHRRWENKSKKDGVERDSLSIYQLRKLRWEKKLREYRV